MNEKNQFLIVLKDISQDLADISKALKAAGVPSSAPVTVNATKTAGLKEVSIKNVRMMFPEELEEMLFFEGKDEYIVIKPRRFLGSENFARVASIVRVEGGEYISAGRDSHFRISKAK
jgi:hypothetical protein